MKKLATAFVFLLMLGGGVAAMAADDLAMDGGYVWQRDDGTKEGELTASFSPVGDGKWDVAFSFDWEDGPHVYTGTCEGSLTGDLSGDIKSDGDREMRFRFNGAFEDGTFNGTHAFVSEDGELKDSGTLSLWAAGGDDSDDGDSSSDDSSDGDSSDDSDDSSDDSSDSSDSSDDEN